MLSSFGPMLDHHFAERHPGHSHLYLHTAEPDHSHPFEHSHIHYDAMYAPAPGDEGIVFFAPYDGAGHPPADLATPVSSPVFAYDDSDGSVLLDGSWAVSVMKDTVVLPLLPPPRS